MILAFALAVAILFGAGAYLLLQRDLVRVSAGVILISQSAVVAIIGSSQSRGTAPIDVRPDEQVSDPLTQAMALTALVIGLATVALLLALVHRALVVLGADGPDDEEAAPDAEDPADSTDSTDATGGADPTPDSGRVDRPGGRRTR